MNSFTERLFISSFIFFRLALQYGLHLLYKEEFQEIYNREHGHPEYGPLLEKMKVVDADGTSQMDEDQWEAASAYSSPSTFTPHSSPSSHSPPLLTGRVFRYLHRLCFRKALIIDGRIQRIILVFSTPCLVFVHLAFTCPLHPFQLYHFLHSPLRLFFCLPFRVLIL